MPSVSVIIPTHNRRSILELSLEALNQQTIPQSDIEVIVVLDGCTDGTLEWLKAYKPGYDLKVLEQKNQGPAVARNYGASHALGNILLFLDDDVIATSQLLQAHLKPHQEQSELVVIGPYPSVPERADDFLTRKLRLWWDLRFEEMAEKGYRFRWSSLYGGNFSIRKDLFQRIGGFDTDFRVHEDGELGMRLLKKGIELRFEPDALSYHFVQSDLRAALLRKQREGREDVLLVNKHAELLPALRVCRHSQQPPRWRRFLLFLAFRKSSFFDAMIGLSVPFLSSLERFRLRNRWRQLQSAAQNYWYWRGVAGEFSSRKEFANWMTRAKTPQSGRTSDLDLDLGMEFCERKLDEESPDSATIRFRSHQIGSIQFQPGTEPLQGKHLKRILMNYFARPLLESLALEGALPVSAAADRKKLVENIRLISPWFGQSRSNRIWEEHRKQWSRVRKPGTQADP